MGNEHSAEEGRGRGPGGGSHGYGDGGHGRPHGAQHGGRGRGAGFKCGKPFRGHGFRLTMPRRIIVEALEAEDDYLSAEELYQRVRERGGERIGLATVYRTLQLLEEHGFVHRLDSGEGRSRYKLAAGEEEYNRKVFVCRSCRRSFPAGVMSEEELSAFAAEEERMRREYGFRVGSRVMQFFGTCGACEAQRETHNEEEEK